MKTITIIIISAMLALAGCKSAQESSKNETAAADQTSAPVNTSTTTTNQQEDSAMNTNKQESVYRLVISFISIGEGTDPDARKILDQVVDDWSKKSGKQIEMETFPWGREGEADFCFQLNELSVNEQASFVKDIRKAMEGRNLIQVAEFQKSMNKR